MDATPSEYIIMLGPGEKNGTALLAALWVEVSSARVVVGGSMGLVEGWHGMGVEEVIDLKRMTVVINEASGQPGVQCLLVSQAWGAESLGTGSCCPYISPQWTQVLFDLDTDGWSSYENQLVLASKNLPL